MCQWSLRAALLAAARFPIAITISAQANRVYLEIARARRTVRKTLTLLGPEQELPQDYLTNTLYQVPSQLQAQPTGPTAHRPREKPGAKASQTGRRRPHKRGPTGPKKLNAVQSGYSANSALGYADPPMVYHKPQAGVLCAAPVRVGGWQQLGRSCGAVFAVVEAPGVGVGRVLRGPLLCRLRHTHQPAHCYRTCCCVLHDPAVLHNQRPTESYSNPPPPASRPYISHTRCGGEHPLILQVLGKAWCKALPAPAQKGRQGAEAALVSRQTMVPLLPTKNPFPQRLLTCNVDRPTVCCNPRGGALCELEEGRSDQHSPSTPMTGLRVETTPAGAQAAAADQTQRPNTSPGGGGTPWVLGRQLPLPPPPPPMGLRPTVSCQRCRPWASMGAEGTQRSMGTKGARRQSLSTLHPNTILKPNPDPNARPIPTPSPNPTRPPSPNPTPTPSPSPSSNPRRGSELVWGSTMESNDVAKAAMNEILGILFSPINMASMAEPSGCTG